MIAPIYEHDFDREPTIETGVAPKMAELLALAIDAALSPTEPR